MLAPRQFKATNFWAVTGTPFNTSVSDLLNQLRLLRLPGFGSAPFFNTFIADPWNNARNSSGDRREEGREAARVCVALLRQVAMRHSKLQQRPDGSPLVQLPDRDARTEVRKF